MLLAVHYRVMEHAGSLERTQEGYRLGQLLRTNCAIRLQVKTTNQMPA